MPGRTSKFDLPETRTAFLAVVAAGNYLATACRAVGVSYDSYKRYVRTRKTNPDAKAFLKAIRKAEADGEVAKVARLVWFTERDDMVGLAALKHYMGIKYPKRWGNQQREILEALKLLKKLNEQSGEPAPGDG